MIEIELRSSQPIYEQIVAQIKEQVVKGMLRPGDAIPSIRKMSMMTQVNPNTVSRAYQELERTGVIETLIGRGTFIKAGYAATADEETLGRIRSALKPPLMEFKLLGLKRDAIYAQVETVLMELEGMDA